MQARQFTDPQVSVKERMRSLSGNASEAPRFIINASAGKCHVQKSLGEIVGNKENSFAGEFCVVEEVSSEEMQSAFQKHAMDGKFLDLIGLKRAMHEVGRRINEDEVNRLVHAFDTSGDSRVQYDEFEFGLKSMIGTFVQSRI